MTTVALIPSYQPDVRLVDLVSTLRSCGVEGVVVDDGSGDRYRTLFDAVRRFATVIGYGSNCGKGHALKRGLAYIQQHYPDDTVVVTVDADGQHDPSDVLLCAHEAQEAGDALVLGCRTFDGPGVPWRSRVGNTITRRACRIVSGLQVSDTQTGLRAFSARLISLLLAVGGERYEYEMNVLLACPAHDVPIREVPIRTIYEEGNPTSHFRPVVDSLLVYRGILLFAASSFACFLLDYAVFALLGGLVAPWGSLGIVVANVGARLASASVNFLINRSLVFGSTEGLYVTAVRYALLALGIVVANTLTMLLLTELLGVSALVAKPVVEVLFFCVSWSGQRIAVFPGGE